MKISLGLKNAARVDLVRMLSLLLTDEYVLYATTWDYHWQTGPECGGLQEELATQYEQIAQCIDEIATHTLNAGDGGHWAGLTKAVRSSADRASGLTVERMLEDLLVMHDEIILQLHADTKACTAEPKNAGTAAFLTDLTEQHESAVWILRAQLETMAEKTSQIHLLGT
jgi:starvation-inducible DNA-binding protein